MKCKFCPASSKDSNLWTTAHLTTGKISACPKCYPKMEKYLFELRRENNMRKRNLVSEPSPKA